MKPKIVLCLVCLLVLPGLAWQTAAQPAVPHAATYYVDRSHPSASDSNPGSKALPWLTIQHAADGVAAGDTVYVTSGTYDERVQIERDGTAAQKITFQAVPRRSVLVTHGFNISADAIRIVSFEITHNAGGWLGGGIWMGGNDVELVDKCVWRAKVKFVLRLFKRWHGGDAYGDK